MSTALYEVKNISKSYGSVVALNDVSLKIHAGEVIGLVGDNGAGKSTLVKVLSGAHQQSEGTVILEGVERKWESPHDALVAGVETLYQDSGLAPHLSVSANVFLVAKNISKAFSESLVSLRRKRWMLQHMKTLKKLALQFLNQIALSHNFLVDSAKQ